MAKIIKMIIIFFGGLIVTGSGTAIGASDVLVSSKEDIVTPGVKWHPGHYLMVYLTATDDDMPMIIEDIAITPAILGIQRTYKWKNLEPVEGKYDLSAIKRDLNSLAAIGKRLVIQIQAKSNRTDQVFVPSYLLKEKYDGGIYYHTSGGNNAAYWNAGVQERLIMLIQEMGRQLDGYANLEAVNFEETAPSNRDPAWAKAHLDEYLDGMSNVAIAAKQAFPHTVVLQYINWPVKELSNMISRLRTSGVGVGGPDVFIEDEGLAQGSYRYIASVAGDLPIGMAVQYGNYSQKSDNHKYDPPGINALHEYARDKLRANYIFWQRRTREPANGSDYYRDLKKYLSAIDWRKDPSGGLGVSCPKVIKTCIN